MIDYGIVTEAGTVRFERLLPGPIERVWSYLTESDKRGTWLASGQMELRVGGRVELNFHHADLTPHDEAPPDNYRPCDSGPTTHGTVTRCEPPRLLSYTWEKGSGRESEVTFELSRRGRDVLLVLTHRRLGDRTTMVSVAGGWHTHLGVLGDVLGDKVPQPFWSTYERLAGDYGKRLPSDLGHELINMPIDGLSESALES